ncbi:MAG: hypothetical protein GW876_06140 [Bacteroidetes bacterium]|nr:hypothetical protein [Bacteroidota bacterium]
MLIQYSFLDNTEPTDEQLHLLMQEVTADVKTRAKKSDEDFFKQLHVLVQIACSKKNKTIT